MPAIPKPFELRASAGYVFRCWSTRPMMAPHAGLERRVLAALEATPSRIPVVLGGCGSGRTTLLHGLADRLGRGACQYIDVERAASTPERFHRAVIAHRRSPRRFRHRRPPRRATPSIGRCAAARACAGDAPRRSCSTSCSSCARSRASRACATSCASCCRRWRPAPTASC